MELNRSKILETSLVLTTGFLVVFIITRVEVLLYISLAFGITGIFVKPLAKFFAIAWFKLADVLNFVMSRIILGTLFFVILFPVSVLYRLRNKNKMFYKPSGNSNWIERNVKYSSDDLKNIW